MNDIETAMAEIEKLSPELRQQMHDELVSKTKNQIFIPNPGPQTEAYYSPADIMLYGGAAGSGKSGLILGCAFTDHQKTLIMRRQYTDIDGLTSDAMRLFQDVAKLSGGARPKIKTQDGRLIEFGACKHPGDEQSWQGQPHDLLAFDEVTQFMEYQFRYLQTWNRTVEKGQRSRIIAATNPPTSAQGEWVIGYWRPWLDPNHPNPAKHGELRWFVTDPDGKDMEVDGPEPMQFPGRNDVVVPKSRTFIPGKVDDNPYLIDSGYKSTLDALPEPLRSAMRDGNFMLSRKDVLNQVIPTQWVREAMARWEAGRAKGVPMCAIGVDVCTPNGEDNLTLAPRYDGWFDEIIKIPGKALKDESDMAAQVVKHRLDAADIILDMGGGYGGSTKLRLKDNGIDIIGYKGVESTERKTVADRKVGFTNKRSAAYWAIREALDPSQPGGSSIALPNSTTLLADLTAPTFELTKQGFKIEPKKLVRERLGRSPDEGDAVVMSWWAGPRGMAPTHPAQVRRGKKRGPAPKVIMGHQNKRRTRR